MIAYFLLGVGLLASILFLGNWFSTAQPASVLKAVRWLLAFLVVAAIIYLALSGRLAWALAASPLVLPFLFRFRALYNRLKAMQGGSSGQKSHVTTRFLRVVLDHDTGALEGEVLHGYFTGRALSDLTLAELTEFYDECDGDEQSVSILEAYVARRFGDDWREQASGQAAGNDAGYDNESSGAATRDRTAAMSRAEALEILGLEDGVNEREIKDAHRRLMQKLHPDHGGSTYLATQINRAKDVLLRRSG